MTMLASAEEKKPMASAPAQEKAAPEAGARQNTTASEPAVSAPTVSAAIPKAARVDAGNQKTPAGSGYDKAMKTLQEAGNNAPSFSSDYDGVISDLYAKITNREPFRYDHSTDPLYGQYKEQYVQQGQQAMRDTMGQAASLTGGYGSSYGQAVGQQAYDAYLARLNDVLPELYGKAYDRWSDEGQQLAQQFQMAGAMRDTEYGQFRDAVGDKNYQDAWKIQQAEARAQYGDFSGYADIYGKDAADNMFYNWAALNPQLAYAQGVITEDQYTNLIEGRPINDPQGASGGTGGGGSRALADILRDQAQDLRRRNDLGGYADAMKQAERL